MTRLSPSARFAVRLMSLAALAAGGIVVGRGVASFATEHTTPTTALALSATDARPTAVAADSSSAPGAPAFSSYLRSWAVSPPMQAGSAPAQTIAGPVAPTVVPPDANTDATTMYTVVPGDTLSGIAVRYGVGLHDLMQANALVDSDSLTVGTRLIVPTSAQPSSTTVAAAGPAADGPHPSTGATTMYTVMPGDTLSGIAFRYGLGLHDLVQANNLVDTESLAAGTRLVVPTSAQPSSTTVAAAVVTPPVQLPSGTPEPVVTTGVDTPEAAVRSFYAHLNQADFSGAAGLWTAHMRKAFPPAQNIDSRFAQTQSLSVQRADVVALDTAQGRATVALRLTEVAGSPAQTRTYAGNWYLVRESSGWLLDQPDLHTT